MILITEEKYISQNLTCVFDRIIQQTKARSDLIRLHKGDYKTPLLTDLIVKNSMHFSSCQVRDEDI